MRNRATAVRRASAAARSSAAVGPGSVGAAFGSDLVALVLVLGSALVLVLAGAGGAGGAYTRDSGLYDY